MLLTYLFMFLYIFTSLSIREYNDNVDKGGKLRLPSFVDSKSRGANLCAMLASSYDSNPHKGRINCLQTETNLFSSCQGAIKM